MWYMYSLDYLIMVLKYNGVQIIAFVIKDNIFFL